ncbi:unnamed protein product [Prunus brigantina]
MENDINLHTRVPRVAVDPLEPPLSCIGAICWFFFLCLIGVYRTALKLLTLMDPRYTGEILKHLEKQSELLKEAKISMSEELHQLKVVEEEMLMRKFYEIMSAHGKVKKSEDPSKVSDDGEIGNSTAIVTTTSNEECG